MKRIIFHDFERQWLIWGGLCLACLIVGLSADFDKDWNIIFTPVWMTVFLRRFDQYRGNLRVLLTLPFTARKIGRIFWWLRVGIPTLLLALFGGLGILIHQPTEIFGVWLKLTLIGGLLFGSIFWLFSGARSQRRRGWENRIWKQIYSCGFFIALIGGGYFLFYKSAINHEIQFIIICFFGFVFSVFGWFRAESMVIDYGGYRQEISDSNKKQRIFKPRPGYGGILFLITRSCLRCLGIAALIMVFCIGISAWHSHHIKWSNIESWPMLTAQFWFFFLCFIQIIKIGPHLKFLRSLPLTSKQLAATILCLAIMPILIWGGIYTALASAGNSIPSPRFVFSAYMLGLAPVCVMTTATIWYDEKRIERIIYIVILLILSAIPLIYQLTIGALNSGQQNLPLWIIIAVPFASYLLALLTISRLLERNDMTYRIRQEMLDSWQ